LKYILPWLILFLEIFSGFNPLRLGRFLPKTKAIQALCSILEQF
jgi:hypothetical protein